MTNATQAEGLVLQDRRGDVLLLTLNRPDRLNAWNDALEDEYFAILNAADADPTVRAVVLTGAGKGFCAGADMHDLGRASVDPGTMSARPLPRSYPLSFRKPLIAAVNGAAAGLGLVEALYCDVRFAVPSAKFLSAFARRGLIAEYGAAWILPRLVGTGRALDLLMSGRVVLGDEAYRMGLVDFLVEPEELVDRAVAYAQELATSSSPTSMSIIKSQVLEALDTDFASAVRRADAEMAVSFTGVDVQEGVNSYRENRPPRFAPLGPRARGE